MMRCFSFFLMYILLYLTSYAQSNYLYNPVCLGPILIEQPKLERMVDVCQSYKLKEDPCAGTTRVFHHDDGTVVEFKVDEVEGRKYPMVKIITKEAGKSIDKILLDTGYKKEAGNYYKGSKFEHRRTKCTVSGSKRKTLIFEKEYTTQ